MSEIYNGVSIGTCTNLYYVRREEIEQEVKKSDEAKRFLLDVFRYRFPWPDEDGQSYRNAGQRKYDRTIQFSVPDLIIPHKEICVPIDHAGTAYRFNTFLPCPASLEFTFERSREQVMHPIEIVGEEYTKDNRPYTVFACSYCRQYFVLDEDNEIELIRKTLRNYAKGLSDEELYVKVAERIRGLSREVA